jgi:hypothetical protein
MSQTSAIMTPQNFKELVGEISERPPLVPEFKTLNEIPKAESETFLIYGPSGAGKTRLLGTCGDRTLIVSNGGGISTLKSPKFKELVGSNPIVVELNATDENRELDFSKVHDALCDTLDYALEKFPERFDYVCVDDATFMRRGAMYKGLEIGAASNKSNTKKNILEVYNELVPAVQDYGMEMGILDTFFATYTQICKEAKKHFIVCAHERLSYSKPARIGEPPELIKTAPAFTGVDKNPSGVALYFDNVWYMECLSAEQGMWRIRTVGHDKLIAKTRFDGVFDKTIPVPAKGLFMQDCIKKMKEAEKAIGKK